MAGAITFRAWDQTSGTNGAVVSTISNGGNTAFSANTDTASLTINGAPGAATANLLFTTAGNQTSAAGGITWNAGQVLQYGNAGDRFDIDGNLTTGTVELLAGFATTVPVRAMHYVQTAITIGTGLGTTSI